MASTSLYSPLDYRIHYGPGDYQFYINSSSGSAKIQTFVSTAEYEAYIAVEATDVLYSLSGEYYMTLKRATISLSHSTLRLQVYLDTLYSYLYMYLVSTDPTLIASESAVNITNDQTLLTLLCTPSSSELIVTWREGQEQLDTANGVVLEPVGLNHKLTLDLETYTLTGADIVCEV